MIKLFEFGLDPEVVCYPDQLTVNLTVSWEDLSTACLAFCLLQEGLILKAIFKSRQSAVKVSIERLNSEPGGLSRANTNENECQIFLSMDSLGCVQHFLLKYYRDGVAEVDHVDIQARSSDGADAYVIFLCS